MFGGRRHGLFSWRRHGMFGWRRHGMFGGRRHRMFGGRRHRMFGWLRNRMFGRLRDRMSGGRWIRMPGGIWHGVFGRLRNRDVIREADVVLVIVGAASHIHTIRDTLANALCPHVLVVPVGEPVPIARRADGSHEAIVHLVTWSLRPNQSQVVIAASPCGFVGNDLFDGECCHAEHSDCDCQRCFPTAARAS